MDETLSYNILLVSFVLQACDYSVFSNSHADFSTG